MKASEGPENSGGEGCVTSAHRNFDLGVARVLECALSEERCDEAAEDA
jgi:hypothetical protein